ncbi:MAG: hypothetical protein PHD67_07465 [Oscillospiraceae bacterium]|nr:hypothetical protein [Oscillospiraceae bacterium]
MVDILMVGGGGDPRLVNAVKETICRNFSAAVFPGASALLPALPEDYMIHEFPESRWSFPQQSILVCKRGFSPPPVFSRSACAVGLLSSDNHPAAHFLKTQRVKAVTCGMSVRDTLTFSSLGADSAVLCLQRSLPMLSGAVQEPFELPLKLSPGYDAYSLLCLSGILILSGKSDRLSILNC